METQRVMFQTSDNVTIVGDYIAARPNAAHLLLLHMMPATRDSYRAFAEKLREAGYASLAIDLRGHGESTQHGEKTLSYKRFSDAEHQASIRDVEAAVGWLTREHGAPPARMALVGASIGANLSLQYLAEHPTVPQAILLSAGLDYRGISTEPFAKKLLPTQAVFFVASDDDEYSLGSHRTLFAVTSAGKKIKELHNCGHGTTMLEREPALAAELIHFLQTP